MKGLKKNEKTGVQKAESGDADTFWRKPITLDSFETEDPLETLYRGREAAESVKEETQKPDKANTNTGAKKSKAAGESVAPKTKKTIEKKTPEPPEKESSDRGEKSKTARPGVKVSEAELKDILKIKGETFQFTDIREILRGKSFDMYAYLRFLSGESGICKIKHNDLMRKLDISRPTLFKQGDWLVRLSLIEKRNVPGDHMGTSYTVYRVEDVLPVSEPLVRQVETAIKGFRSEDE